MTHKQTEDDLNYLDQETVRANLSKLGEVNETVNTPLGGLTNDMPSTLTKYHRLAVYSLYSQTSG